MSKVINPYSRLRSIAALFANKVMTRRRVCMWSYPKDQLNKSWTLYDLYERVQAAAQLGWNVELVASEHNGLVVNYVEKLPSRPFEF